MSSVTPKEENLIRKLKDNLRDVDLQGDHFSDENVDSLVLRFLRARDLNLSRAEDMLRKHITWKRDNKIDDILDWTPPQNIQAEYPFEICGFDREGCPILVVPFGLWDIRGICEKGMKSDYVRYVDQLFAKVIHAMQNEDKNVTQFIGIFLPDELSAFRQMSSVQAVDAVLETVRRFESNYPETLKAAFVVDTPKVFQTIFNVIRPLLNSKTLGKVTIASSIKEWHTPLMKLVDENQLPTRLGGTRNRPSHIPVLNKTTRISTPTQTPDDFTGLHVAAGKRLTVEYDIDKPTNLNWAFKTEKCDIGFSILFEGTQILLPYQRLDSHNDIQCGQVKCRESDILLFDNTFSRWRGKVVRYRVTLEVCLEADAEAVNGRNGHIDLEREERDEEEEFRRNSNDPLAFQYLFNSKIESMSL